MFYVQSFMLADSQACNVGLVADKYFGAQQWYETMSKKYPQAHLNKIQFGISDSYESGVGIIYFPEYRLQSMQEIFGNIDPKEFTKDMFLSFAEDEYLLLHEASHVLKNDVRNGGFAVICGVGLVATAFLRLVFNFQKNKIDQPCVQTDCAIVTGASILACTAVILYARFQEYCADSFANQNADAAALKAGKSWFDRLNTLMNFENIAIPDCLNSFSQFLQDPVHPTPKTRSNSALRSFMIRFGQIA